MNEIFLTCPYCHSRLSVPYSPGFERTVLTCGVCGYNGYISSYHNTMGDYYHDPVGYNNPQDQMTQMANSPQMPQMPPMPQQPQPQPMLSAGFIVMGQNKFTLKMGRNVIGRKASTSKAEIQIPTDDRYMSRVHAQIEVIPQGNSIKYRLCPMSPKNPIKINGRVIPEGVTVDVRIGDTLTFGHTDLLLAPGENPQMPQQGIDHTVIAPR